jgi:hypothetical protein
MRFGEDFALALGAGLLTGLLWRDGVKGGYFEPFGPVSWVTIAIILMATNA